MGARPRRCHGSFWPGFGQAFLGQALFGCLQEKKKKSLELVDSWAARGGKRSSAASGTGRTALAWPIPASSADADAGSAGNWARSSSVASCPSISRGGQRGGGSGSAAGGVQPLLCAPPESPRGASPVCWPLPRWLFAFPSLRRRLRAAPLPGCCPIRAISSDPAPLLGGTALFP